MEFCNLTGLHGFKLLGVHTETGPGIERNGGDPSRRNGTSFLVEGRLREEVFYRMGKVEMAPPLAVQGGLVFFKDEIIGLW